MRKLCVAAERIEKVKKYFPLFSLFPLFVSSLNFCYFLMLSSTTTITTPLSIKILEGKKFENKL